MNPCYHIDHHIHTKTLILICLELQHQFQLGEHVSHRVNEAVSSYNQGKGAVSTFCREFLQNWLRIRLGAIDYLNQKFVNEHCDLNRF
jgi:hypothetical protein